MRESIDLAHGTAYPRRSAPLSDSPRDNRRQRSPAENRCERRKNEEREREREIVVGRFYVILREKYAPSSSFYCDVRDSFLDIPLSRIELEDLEQAGD